MRHPYSVEIWYKDDIVNRRITKNSNVAFGRVDIEGNKKFHSYCPKSLVKISSKDGGYILHAGISQSSKFITIVENNSVVRVMSLRVNIGFKKHRPVFKDLEVKDYATLDKLSNHRETITGIACTEDNLYICSEELILRAFIFKSKALNRVYQRKSKQW